VNKRADFFWLAATWAVVNYCAELTGEIAKAEFAFAALSSKELFFDIKLTRLGFQSVSFIPSTPNKTAITNNYVSMPLFK
jgi:hypothetical protein